MQKFSLTLLCLIFSLFFSSFIHAQDDDPIKGKALFNANCAACHQLDKKMTGPALRNVETRLYEDEGLVREWLYAWIRKSSALIKSGDDYANRIYNEYNGAAMTAYPQFSDQDISNILAYTAEEKATPPAVATVATTQTSSNEGGFSKILVLSALAVLFTFLA